MRVFSVEQRTEEWHRLRYGKIGGTGSKSLHVKGKTQLYELVACRMEEFKLEESGTGKAAQDGIDKEPEAFKAACRYAKKKFLEVGWIESEEYPLLGYSPDGITKNLKDGLEIKSPTAKVHVKYQDLDEVPPEYTDQIAHAFTVNDKLERMHFMSFRPESKVPLFMKVVNRKSELNFGTEARPKMDTIDSMVKLKKELTKELETQITETITKISF